MLNLAKFCDHPTDKASAVVDVTRNRIEDERARLLDEEWDQIQKDQQLAGVFFFLIQCSGFGSGSLGPVLRIRIHRIHMFLGLPDPDPDPAPDPDPSIIMQI